MSRYSSFDISSIQRQAVYNTGNNSLISVMNQGTNYYNSGNHEKASVYHQYAIDGLKNNYNINFIDNNSVAAVHNNNLIISNKK